MIGTKVERMEGGMRTKQKRRRDEGEADGRLKSEMALPSG
jgi:hypothetical protein